MIVPICFSCSNYYVPYMSVCLLSLKECIHKDNMYEITIFEKDISQKNKEILSQIIALPNVTVHFFNVEEYIKNKEFIVHDHVSIETFFKIFIPLIFNEKEKVLYCDSDILFCKDPAEIFRLDMGDKKIACTRCHFVNGIMQNNKKIYRYLTEKVALKNPKNYFQAGILLFNNKFFSARDVDEIFHVATTNTFAFLDQDVLNQTLQDKVFFLDTCWNYETSQENFRRDAIPFMEEYNKKEWENAFKNPFIIHYSGAEKPWFFPQEQLAEKWWSFAVKSPFFYEIVIRLEAFKNSQTKNAVLFKRNMLQYVKYKILCKLMTGEKLSECVRKKKNLKKMLKRTKLFLKKIKKGE